MESRSESASLGRRFLATVILVAIVPLGLIGLWTTRSSARSGRALLAAQLDAQLDRTIAGIRGRWERRKSDLMLLAENEPVRLALRDATVDSAPVPEFVRRAFAQMTGFSRITFRDREGRTRWTLDDAGSIAIAREDARGIAVELPITDMIAGDTIGTVEATLRLVALLPEVTSAPPRDGPLTAAYRHGDGAIVPPTVDEHVFSDETLTWGGHRWMTVRRAMADPPLDVVMAGALDPYVGPFQSAARASVAVLLAGAVAALFVIVIVTRRMSREVERRLAQREALATVGEFASELSHEVRNPLTAMRLDLQLVQEAAGDAAIARSVLPRVLLQIDRLDRAVTGALRVSRGASIDRQAVDLASIIEAARRAAEPEFHQRGATLTTPRRSDPPIELDGDADALQQLFLNLLINAAHALPAGGSALVTAEQRANTIHVTIADDGAGMSEPQIANLDKPYRSSKRNGNGLGLKIARRIVASHGGTMMLESTLGVGTTVRVSLPRTAEDRPRTDYGDYGDDGMK
jgi:signal transduction histidine kinase